MKIASFFSLAAILSAQVGMPPRPAPSDYSAQAPSKAAVVAATLLPPDQVQRIFGVGLDRAGYLVFEVAIFHDDGRQPVITTADFVLQAPPNTAVIRMSAPAAVAAALFPFENLQPAAASPAKAAGRRGEKAEEAPPLSARDRARNDLQFALSAKILPSGKLTTAVAGYLYFRKPAGIAKSYQLIWFGPDAPSQLTIQAPAAPPAPRKASKPAKTAGR